MRNKHKIYQILIAMISCFLIFTFISKPVSAIESTTYTYTLGNDWTYIRTQDGYMPGGTYLSEIGLKTPEDIFVRNDILYVADSGNARIVKYDMQSGSLKFLAEGNLVKPTGISVGLDGRIYIADYGNSEIVILSREGEVQKRIAAPTSQIYGSGPYKPQKIDVDSFNNIYVTSEGTNEGILQFDASGNFNGFFGANKAEGLTFTELLQDIFYTDAQKAQMFFRTPPMIVNIDVSIRDLVYSVTQMNWDKSIKKLNMAGTNLFGARKIYGENNYVDVTVSQNGEFFAVTDTGSIEEFDEDGTTLLLFGGNAVANDRNGLTTVVSAIEVDGEYNIYILDKERGLIQTYYPTDYANMIHEALSLNNAGNYDESKLLWEELIKINPRAMMSHFGYANTLFQLGDYKLAGDHYKLIGVNDNYSECYWQIRSEWLRKNLYRVLIYIIIIMIILGALNIWRKKRDFVAPLYHWWNNIKKKYRIIKDLTYLAHMIRHPLDSLFDLKRGTHGSIYAATVLYFIAFFVRILDSAFRSFLYNRMEIDKWTDPFALVIGIVAPIALFVIGNYLIGSINDGEAHFKDVYIGVAYSFSAYIIFTPIMTIISYVLTYNEEFLVIMYGNIILGYTALLLFLTAKEMHAYSFRKTIINILLTLAFIIIVIIATIVLYALWNSIIKFFSDVLEEVRYRVF